MTINAAKHHNYIVRAIGGEKIKYVNEIIQGIESNKGEIKKIEAAYKENKDKSVPDYHRTSASFNNRAGIAGV